MKALISFGAKQFSVDLSAPIDLSIPIMQGEKNVNAFYIAPVTYIPFQAGSFVGDVNQGGSCNVNTITINPHGNGAASEEGCETWFHDFYMEYFNTSIG